MEYGIESRQRKRSPRRKNAVPRTDKTTQGNFECASVCVCVYIYIYIFFLDATLASPHLSVMVRRRSITQIQCIVHCPLAEPMKDESTWK